MNKTTYQKPELRDANDNIIQQGAFGKNTALANSTNDGWIDYVANNLEFLYDLAKDNIVPVSALPASGQMNKTYLLTTTGVCYRWSGTAWVEISSSEAVGRAETAANLAEQWATKTDGTVYGTEYSAKYYAQQAEASADDAQDVADDMADHLVQIDKNTGGVAKNSKRISNIEKLLQGNLYDYDTDDDTAYTKTVPSGALPYAGVEKIGGKTLVWNQLVKNQDVSNTGDGITTAYDSTTHLISITNDSRTTNFSTGSTQFVLTDVAPIIGHKYIVRVSPHSNESVDGVAVIFSYNSNIRQTYQANTIATFSSENSANGMRLRVTSAYDFVDAHPIGNVAKYYINVVDLTLAFGSGNEPSTVAEFKAMFPADYYPYNAGTLLSAGVTEVESVGKNLAYYGEGVGVPSNTATSNATKRIFEVGKYVLGLTYNNYYAPTNITQYSAVDNTITVTNSSSGYGLAIPFNCFGGKNYTINLITQTGGSVRVGWYAEDGTYISGNVVNAYPTTLTAPSGARQGTVILYGATSNVQATFNNVIVAEGTTATYVPAKATTQYPIPAEVRALEGYGWSAGTAYNYIDFERKVFVQNVGRVDLGTLTWIYNNNVYGQYFSTTMNTKKDGLAGFVCAKYETFGGGISSITSSTGIAQSEFQLKAVYIVDPAYTNASAFKSAMSGVYAYYQLATPIETDISQYLTDNLVEVDADGTITFPNQNGADYHIPVPSDVTYMIDLQEAVSNG